MGRPRRRVGGERSSRLRLSGEVSDSGAANRGLPFRRPHRRTADGRSMNGPLRARLKLRSQWLRRCRTDAQEEGKTTPRRLERTDLARPDVCALPDDLAAAGPASLGIACIEFSRKLKKRQMQKPIPLVILKVV